MKPLSIRWKFALWAASLVGVVLALFSVGTYVNLYHEQLEAVDKELEGEHKHLASLPHAAAIQQSIGELVRFQPWLAMAIFADDGTLVRRSPEFPEVVARAALTEDRVHTARDAADMSWRLRTLKKGSLTFVLGFSLVEVHEIVRDLLLAYTLCLPLALGVAGIGGWWIAGKALKPLHELTERVSQVNADDLGRRVPVSKAGDDIARLAEQFNEMLSRLENSFRQSQRFAADASHELRTPLTIVHAGIERLLRTPGLSSDQEDKLVSLQEEISRLNRISEDLLLLAKFDSHRALGPRAPLNFSDLVESVADDAELLATAQGISLTREIAPGLFVNGGEAHLRRLVLNLLDNAIRHNRPAGTAHCRLEVDGSNLRLIVGNTGPGISADARAQLFERFFRSDAARVRGGHGLGLSLCREIAHAHHGSAAALPTIREDWTEFEVTLPMAGS